MVTYPETSIDHGFQFLFGYFTAPSVSSPALQPQTGFSLHFFLNLTRLMLTEGINTDTC